MNITREVIVDLLPIYMAGDASPATKALVEEYLKEDPELSQRIRLQWAESLKRAAPSGLAPELELRSLKRTRRILVLQKWLFGLALAFAAIGLSFEFSTSDGQVREAHFLVRDYPEVFGAFLICSAFFWTIYFLLRVRIRRAGF